MKRKSNGFLKYTSPMTITAELSPVVQKCCRLSQRRLARILTDDLSRGGQMDYVQLNPLMTKISSPIK